jgi:hypothetical protein
MLRERYFSYIDEKLITLSVRVEKRGKLNLLGLHVHSENFYRDFFNLLYGYGLENLNNQIKNVPAIDLIDRDEKIVVQVSSTATKEKIQTALKKDILEDYKDYKFKFISISKSVENLKNKDYINEYGLEFDPDQDIHDIQNILSDIMDLEVEEMKDVYEFIKAELGGETDHLSFETNLAAIINVLSKENYANDNGSIQVDPFEIDKKIQFNDLANAKDIIKEYTKHHPKVDAKYQEFDRQGVNKSLSVLSKIKKLFIEASSSEETLSADNIYLRTVKKVLETVMESSNLDEIRIDELELCVDVLVVDAFIRCKIFKSPEGYSYATA